MSTFKNTKGLTLIELLVTIAVIAIVAAISIPVITNVIDSSRDNATSSMEAQVQNFIERYSEAGQVLYDDATKTFTAWVDLDGDTVFSSPEEIISTFSVGEEFYISVDNPAAPANVSVVSANEVYTLTYSANFAGGSSSTETVVGASDVTLSSSLFNRTGHGFTGWNTDPNGGGTNYSAGATYGVSGNTTLYAMWAPNTYVVSFEYNGGTVGITSTNYTYGTSGISLPAPERTGHTFAGWYDNQGLAGNAVSAPYAPTSSVQLYAKWTPNVYTVSFESNGGSTVSAVSYTYGNYGVTLPTPNKSGQTFAGWFNNQGLTGNPVTSPYVPSGNVTLFAKWESASFVVFDASTGPNNSVTGGWNLWNYDGGNVTVGTNSTSVFTYSPWWTNGAAATINNIDLSGAKSITIDFQGSSDNAYGYASISWYKADGTREGYNIINPGNRNVSRQLITIPITNGGVGRMTLDSANTRQYQYLYSIVINY
jgi:uncharacterized repeat protein (TIGR02543 family)/prepilin-type N-terminal cleavage/methylation domain-containing protein